MNHSLLPRRAFLKTVAGAAATTVLGSSVRSEGAIEPGKIKLGMDNFAVRAMGWKASRLLDHAASLKLDTLFISDLEAYESLDEGYLRDVKAKADSLKIELYTGSWSICPTSTRFRKDWGSAEEHLQTGIRVSKALGSPVFRVVLGAAEDRRTPGGIQARIADTVKVLKACESKAKEAGVAISIENHAGDLHSWELIDLVEKAGKDFVGVNLDSGNAAWTLEDPLDLLERLGPYTNCSSLRDDMIWETPEGASIAWTAAGEGLIDWKQFVARWSVLCPTVPIQIETISGFSRGFAYKKADFWQHYDKRPEVLAKFEALAKKGAPIPSFKAPEGADKKVAEQEYQKAELDRSIRYLREVIGIGLKR